MTRICGGFFSIATRSLAGVSPVRTNARAAAAVDARSPPLGIDDFFERHFQIPADVVCLSTLSQEGRNVHHLHAIIEFARQPLSQQMINAHKKRRQRFSRSRRRRDQRMPPRRDLRPPQPLRLRGRTETLDEPVFDDGMKGGLCHSTILEHGGKGQVHLTDAPTPEAPPLPPPRGGRGTCLFLRNR